MSIFNKKISETDVLNYLKENPNFFIKHPEILEILEIEHASGEATSLIEKQVEIIKKKNLDVTNKLSEFLENAEHNQNLFLKMKLVMGSLFPTFFVRNPFTKVSRVQERLCVK